MRRAALLALLLGLTPLSAGWTRAAGDDWRTIMTNRDHVRLKEWRTAWEEALTQARAHGFGAQVDGEGALLQPDAALDRPDIPDGDYRCRIVKLGAQAADLPSYVAYPAAHCRIAAGMLAKLDGSQRPAGRIYPYDGARMLFLGGMALGDEQATGRYGRDQQRNLVGLVERIGPATWRIALARPAWESKVDILELVPAG